MKSLLCEPLRPLRSLRLCGGEFAFALALALALLAHAPAFAQTALMSGSLGDKVLLIIDGAPLYNVEATVVPMPMEFVLLGNSCLTRFQMKRENDVMTLSKRF